MRTKSSLDSFFYIISNQRAQPGNYVSQTLVLNLGSKEPPVIVEYSNARVTRVKADQCDEQ